MRLTQSRNNSRQSLWLDKIQININCETTLHDHDMMYHHMKIIFIFLVLASGNSFACAQSQVNSTELYKTGLNLYSDGKYVSVSRA